MGKMTVLISPTPDGFADSQNVIVDPDFFAFTHSLLADSGIVLFGRNTFEQFQDRWPQRVEDQNSPDWVRRMAQTLNDIPKIVFSSTLTATTWNNTTIVKAMDADYITSLKRKSSKGLITFGSLRLVESLMALNIVDDYYFNLQPFIPGRGVSRFFNNHALSEAVHLKYINCTPMPSGALVIHYQKSNTKP